MRVSLGQLIARILNWHKTFSMCSGVHGSWDTKIWWRRIIRGARELQSGSEWLGHCNTRTSQRTDVQWLHSAGLFA